VRGEAGLGRRPTGAAAPLGTVLGNPQAKRRQVKHLPGLHARHRRTRQVGAAPTALVGHMPGHLVGLLHLRQVGAWGAGLLARPATFGPPIGAARSPRRLAQPVRGWWLRGVGGIRAEPTLQLGHPRLQRGDQAGLLGVGRAQLDDDQSLHRDGCQISFGGRDRAASTTTSRQARLPVGRTEQLPHKPQTVNSFTARRQVLNSYDQTRLTWRA
jgi:hypothetical protein